MHILRSFFFYLAVGILLTACAAVEASAPTDPPMVPSPLHTPTTPTSIPTDVSQQAACPLTGATWAKPPEDSAVTNPPAYGYYYINEDSSIWASAWWFESEKYPLRVTEEGVKVGWFRPAGAELVITGQRIDGEALPLEAHASCCYPTRFQASGLYFPTEGCWEVTAKAEESELTFVVWVEP